MMALQIGDTAPDFEADTTEGRIRFHDWIGDKWVVLFSHPKDFTPVCTTELGYMARIKPDFDKRNVKIIGLSVDPVDNHAKWAADIKETQGYQGDAGLRAQLSDDRRPRAHDRQGLGHAACEHERRCLEAHCG
jgi:alkyl hydroperoxide reductase subunit AhpC